MPDWCHADHGDAFLGVNGRRLAMTNDEAYDFILAIATGELEIEQVAETLRRSTTTW